MPPPALDEFLNINSRISIILKERCHNILMIKELADHHPCITEEQFLKIFW